MESPVTRHFRHFLLLGLLLAGPAAMQAATCQAPAAVETSHRDQAKRLFQRIAGVPPTATQLQQAAEALACQDAGFAVNAAAVALDDKHFYNITLKNFATPWTNEARSVFAPLNDYSATVIGMVRDDKDFREVLYGNYLYAATGVAGLPAYSTTDNQHYRQLEERDISLKDHLQEMPQYYLPEHASAGVMTSRAAARAFFIDGTNRAMFRFTLINHLCRDLEQVNDISRSPDRIRQDVSRSPGGDSRLFLNTCLGCHAGMDPLTQAYAYYHYRYDADNDPDGENGYLEYTEGQVQPKYLINSSNFAYGYVTTDDRWDNYWRAGRNSHLGWSMALPGSGQGAKSMGQELAHSDAFAQCQVKKVFSAVCLREPVNTADKSRLAVMVDDFVNRHNYRLKPVFADAALYCRGD